MTHASIGALVLAFASGLACAPVHAQQDEAQAQLRAQEPAQQAAAVAPAAAASAPAALFQPGAWTAASWSITPQLGVAAGYNDNLRSQSIAVIASPFVAVLPEVTAVRPVGDDQYQLRWRTEWTRFTRSQADDTLNSELAASGLELIGARSALAWHGAWQDWHDALGLASPDLTADSPDHFHALALGAIWRQDDGDDAQHRFEVEPTVSRKRYLDHRDLTAVADADTASLVGRYLHAIDANRRGGVEMSVIRTHFPTDDALLSNTEWRTLATLQWDPAGTFDGHASAGVEWRRFDQIRPPYAGVAWDAEWHWQARPGMVWTLSSTRAAADAPGEDVDEVVTRNTTLGVTEDASARWHGTLSISDGRDHFVGSPFARDDGVRALDLALRHDLSRRWRLSLNFGWVRRESQVGAFDFTRRLTSLMLSAAL